MIFFDISARTVSQKLISRSSKAQRGMFKLNFELNENYFYTKRIVCESSQEYGIFEKCKSSHIRKDNL